MLAAKVQRLSQDLETEDLHLLLTSFAFVTTRHSLSKLSTTLAAPKGHYSLFIILTT